MEQGGQLYIEYTGDQDKETYSVRVSGGNHIPTLDITRASDSNAKRALVTKYVEDLRPTQRSWKQTMRTIKKPMTETGALRGKTVFWAPRIS